MDIFLFFLGCVIVIAIYCVFCKIIANLIEKPKTKKKAFWWVFFLMFLGVIIYLLIDIRDNLAH